MVGDIFDLWIANHSTFIRQYEEIIHELKRIVEEGVEVHYFEGNHDLYLEHFWQNKLGVHVHKKGQLFNLSGYKVYIEHGDQMDPNDKWYLALRWFLRTPMMKHFALHAPEKFIEWIGTKAKDKSRYYTSNVKTIDENQAKQVIRSHVEKLSEVVDFDLHISGHVHVREDYSFSKEDRAIRVVNLGSWLDKPGYFNLNDENQMFCDL